MNKLRFSYTLGNLWRSGRYEDAVNFYLKKSMPKSKAMEMGTEWDNRACEYAIKNNKLLPEFGGDDLKNPRTQVKIEKDFNKICTVVGVIDILTDDIIFELKTGNAKDSADYATDFQVSMYLMLLEEKVDKAYIVHYDQYRQEHDRTLIWNTEQERERGRNFIESLAPEIFSYFEKEGILGIDKNLSNTI